MIFDKQKFAKNAPVNVKRILKPHVDALNGMEVDFSDDYFHGIIARYHVDGEEFHLYPVARDWCSTEKQMDLFK